MSSYAQDVFHVYPIDSKENAGKASGDGSLHNPWDLQTALSQSTTVVNSGDIIFLHAGVYNGRYVSSLKSVTPNVFITVSAFENDKVVLNGNITSNRNAVLEIKGQQVIYKNFEVTFLGEFSRDENDKGFQACVGVRHLTGVNCRFYNLKIYNNPGLGLGSWKHGAGSIIENCLIFNNGYMSKDGKGRGEGIYVQNKSEEVRLIKNTIIFNNYYKGIEVWSAGKRADFEYVKNITLDQNIIFNNGTPSGKFRDNVIVASDDRNGINIAKNITVTNNILYHNTTQPNGAIYGDAPTLTLGFRKNAPIENVIVDGNIIIGGYNGLRILEAKSLRFTNNKIYSGNIQLGPTMLDYFRDWTFHSNVFYSNLKEPFRLNRIKDYSLENWGRAFKLGYGSKLSKLSSLNLEPILYVSQNSQFKNKFNLALFNNKGDDVVVDFSEYHIAENSTYKMYDVEYPDVVLKSGRLTPDFKIIFPMQLAEIERPLHNTLAQKTLTNFGVFILEFDQEKKVLEDKNSDNLVERFFKWLGF